jgi:hypothetical protein
MIYQEIKELNELHKQLYDMENITTIDGIKEKLLSIEKNILRLENKFNSVEMKNDSYKNLSTINIKNEDLTIKINELNNKITDIFLQNSIEDIINSYEEIKRELSLLEKVNDSNGEFLKLNIEYV